MRRTAQELSEVFRKAVASQSEDDIAGVLEDIADSVSDVDMTGYIPKEEYDKTVAERDDMKARMEDYRTRYINRFYAPANQPGDDTYIVGETPQKQIEKDEYDVSYDDLFE